MPLGAEAVEHLAGLAIAGSPGWRHPDLAHTNARTGVHRELERLGVTEATTVYTDYRGAGARRRELLGTGSGRPRSVRHRHMDRGMAAPGAGVASRPSCPSSPGTTRRLWSGAPPLTALTRDNRPYGANAARCAAAVIRGERWRAGSKTPPGCRPRRTAPPPGSQARRMRTRPALIDATEIRDHAPRGRLAASRGSVGAGGRDPAVTARPATPGAGNPVRRAGAAATPAGRFPVPPADLASSAANRCAAAKRQRRVRLHRQRRPRPAQRESPRHDRQVGGYASRARTTPRPATAMTCCRTRSPGRSGPAAVGVRSAPGRGVVRPDDGELDPAPRRPAPSCRRGSRGPFPTGR